MNTVVTKKTMPADLPDRMKRYRLERDWTLRQAAAAAGISDRTWRYLEDGKFPTERIATRIARMIPVLFSNGSREAA